MLKQSTSATILVGPVLASDGTVYTGMAAADFNLTKNGTTASLSGNTVTHSHEGHYLLTLTTGNTDTLGRLVVSCNKSTYAMSPYRSFVYHANVFDVLNGSVAPSTLTAAGVRTELTTELGRIDASVSSRSTFAGGTVLGVLTAVTVGTNNDKTGYSISGTTQTLDALQTAQNTAHGAGSWATATGFSTHSAADVWAVGTRTLTGFGTLVADVATAVWATGTRTLTGFGTLVSQILTAMFVDGATNKLKVNSDNTAEANASVSLSQEDITSIADAVGEAIPAPEILPIQSSVGVGNVLDGAFVRGQYGAPVVGWTISCYTVTSGASSSRDLTSYSGSLALVVFDNDDAAAVSERIVNGSDITVSGNTATISSTASHVLNTVVGSNLRWELRQDTAAPSIVFAQGKYECQRAPLSV